MTAIKKKIQILFPPVVNAILIAMPVDNMPAMIQIISRTRSELFLIRKIYGGTYFFNTALCKL